MTINQKKIDEWVHAELVRQGFEWFDIDYPPEIQLDGKVYLIVRQYNHKGRIEACHKTCFWREKGG